MSVRRVTPAAGADDGPRIEVPEADAAEQQVELLDTADRADVDDAERVVALDEDEYR